MSFIIFVNIVNITSEHNKSYTLIGQIWRIKQLYSPTGEYNKTEIFKMAASRFVEVTDKEISEMNINSVSKNTKACVKY
jgi:tRNA U34 2-thiouridine synthase MnmA/TrmU